MDSFTNVINRHFAIDMICAEHHMTSRHMSSNSDIDDVIVAHRSRSRMYRRPGNNMAAGGAVSTDTRTFLANVVIGATFLTVVCCH